MKTTIDIADRLAREAREEARRRGTTLRALVEEGLRLVLQQPASAGEGPPLRLVTFRGKGVQAGIDEGDWETLRGLLYEGRGG